MTGTPGYLSPESPGAATRPSASDVWALGATLYYAVEGHPPDESQANPLATLQAIASGEARPMEKAGPLGGAIAAMMNADPQQRWDMDTASERLSRIAAGDATMALPVGTALGAGAAAALGGAAATELIRDRVESTQQIEPAGSVAPVAAAAAPPGPPLGYDDEPPGPDDDRRKRRSPLVPILVALAVLGVVAVAYLLTRPNGTGGTDAQTPRVATTTAPAVTKTQSSPSPSSSSSSTSSSSSSTSTTTTQTPSSTTTATTKAPDNAALTKFINSYYGDVTKKNKRDSTFAELTPAYQAKTGGRQVYETFWSGIKSVDVGKTQADAGVGTVIVQLTFHKADGSDSQEVHRITVDPNGSSWLISGDGQA